MGAIKAVILDWAGTVADHGHVAPRGETRLISGAAGMSETLRERGIKTALLSPLDGATLEKSLAEAEKQGFLPDCVVAEDDNAVKEVNPLGIFRCFLALKVWPAAAVVRVTDSIEGIQAGLAAGCWTVGISATGKLLGLSEAAMASLPREVYMARRLNAAQTLSGAGAHFVIDSVRDLPSVIAVIERRMAGGAQRAIA